MTAPLTTPTGAIPTGAASPFKFLDSYTQDDRAVFFGRDEEIETLYRLLGESRLVLVYGASGTGKTSLIQCGLTSKFSATNWLPINVRRGDDLNAALLTALHALAITPLAADATVPQAVRSVYLDHLRPVFLIFDQFEELYVLGTKAEQDQFYTTVQAVLGTDVSCRIIVSLREEYLAMLDPFERAVPSLFDKRLRVETMTHSNVEKVILGTTAAHGIALEHGLETARKIIAQLDEKHIGIALAYLQVYLDHLWRGAVGAAGSGPVTFTDAQVDEAGKLGDIMAGFLDEQVTALQAELEASGTGIAKGGVARLLDEFVTVSGTKQPSTAAEVSARLPICAGWLSAALTVLQNRRLLRLVGDHYEVAHDALAVRIAERRSSERKDLLEIEKIVSDRREGFERTHTFLTSEELTIVKRAAAQKDPMTGDALFVLSEANHAFVADSRRQARRNWIRGSLKFVATIAAIPLLGILAVAVWPETPPDPQVRLDFNKQFNKIDRYTTEMLGSQLDSGKGGTGPLLVLQELGEGNYPYEDYFQFMLELREADKAALESMDGSNERYEKIALKYEQQARANPADSSGWVKAKTVRWHQYYLGSPLKKEEAIVPLIRLMKEPTPAQLQGVDFETDIDEVCGDMDMAWSTQQGCPAQTEIDPTDGGEPPPGNGKPPA